MDRQASYEAVTVRLDIILLAAAALIGAAAAWNGYDMGLIHFNKPGAGLFPLLIGLLLTLLSVSALFNALRAPNGSPARDTDRHIGLELTIFFSLIVYVVALPYVGFAVSSIAFVAFLLYTAGRKSMMFSLAFSIALVIPLYTIFALALKVQLPKSSLF